MPTSFEFSMTGGYCKLCKLYEQKGTQGHDRMVVGFRTTNVPLQSVPIITKVVSSNPTHGKPARCTQCNMI